MGTKKPWHEDLVGEMEGNRDGTSRMQNYYSIATGDDSSRCDWSDNTRCAQMQQSLPLVRQEQLPLHAYHEVAANATATATVATTVAASFGVVIVGAIIKNG